MIDEAWAENQCFQCNSVTEVLERLIVDDGQPSRGHRKTVFNPDFLYCGVASGVHYNLDNVIILEYAHDILQEG